MDKYLKIFLWILLSVAIILTLYIIIKIIVFYFKAKNALNNAWFNTKYCGQKKCPPTNDELNQVIPKSIPKIGWSLEVAKYSTVIIYSLEKSAQDKEPPVYPKDLSMVAELYDNKSDPIFGAIFTEKSGSDTIWIVFRGTLSSTEWVQDLTYQQESMFSKPAVTQVKLDLFKNKTGESPSVHQGFVDVYMNFRDQLLSTIKQIDPDNTKTIMVTGHSLGAAISTLVGVDLSQSGYSNVIVYNFASPRIGNQTLADMINNELKVKVYRFVNLSDMIPNMPPSVSPNMKDTSDPYMYVHCGKLIHFQTNRLSMLNNHLIPAYMQGLEMIK
jgi:hypothetical protein